ncbi:hypothetical protein Mmc1_1901 [Magnetococcus marinus MC-1]|uniref:Uncharacterized protein n=1 Tax=Magnetococcus marinus (strain ATCC BAA-1437 / JCM 17883 / MC-1) TaxID=156889 RepID=A0L8W6_MAGMM|nr:hypothetical protein [Magnetococcus marinus]ABK44409.1 hypothetical protein Mmc1_1901 [Magnetococcus marinus MC-1]
MFKHLIYAPLCTLLLGVSGASGQTPFLTPQQVVAPPITLEARIEQLEQQVKQLQSFVQQHYPNLSLPQAAPPPPPSPAALLEKRQALLKQIQHRKQQAAAQQQAQQQAQQRYAMQQIEMLALRWLPPTEQSPAAVTFGLHNRGEQTLTRVVVEIELLNPLGQPLATEILKPILSSGPMEEAQGVLQPASVWNRPTPFPLHHSGQNVQSVRGRVHEVTFKHATTP